MRGRGAEDIGSSGNVTVESFQSSTGEVATILIFSIRLKNSSFHLKKFLDYFFFFELNKLMYTQSHST